MIPENRTRRAHAPSKRKVPRLRRSSVFPVSDPRVLFDPAYEDATARSVALAGKGMSQQAFHIRRKIAEVN
jgi:predicted RNase H-like nuclease